jgi:predicted outer membrane lipoprotein
MDHHCPWISNCVGFSNRKFFMLFLFYICLTTIVAIAFMAPMFVQEVINAIHTPKYLLNAHVLTRLLGFLLLAAFGVIIAMFFKFHVELVLRNSSTLENLEKVRNPEVAEAKNLFDMGNYENWVQVFGTNAMLWPFPVFGESGKPRGDGVDWRKNDGSN